MKLLLQRLSSEPQIFEPIKFGSGVNLILGEKIEDGSPQGTKVNGVGKTLCVEFIHFGLLREFSQTRVSKIPREALPGGLVVFLDLAINGQALQIQRDIDHPDAPKIVRNGDAIAFQNLEEANRFLADLSYAGLDTTDTVSFRSLMSLLMRDEASEFSEILKTMPLKAQAPGDRLPHLFLLGLGVSIYRRLVNTIRDLEIQSEVLRQLKHDVTQGGSVPIGAIASQLNQAEEDVKRIDRSIAELKTEPAFIQVEKDLNQLESALEALRLRRKAVAYQIDQIRSLPLPELIDETDIAIVYNRVKDGLGDLVVQSLEQAKTFKAEIEAFQRSLLKDERERLEAEGSKLADEIRTNSEKYSELVKRVDAKGALKDLRSGLQAAVSKQSDYYQKRSLYDQYRQAEQRREALETRRQLALGELRNDLRDHADVEASMNSEVANIHERIMGVRVASFRFDINSRAQVKQPLLFDLRIQDDGSHSVDRTKVFIYDCALMFCKMTQKRHPHFLLHDNIFDVDHDTLVQSLNFLQEKIEDGEDFQYILTLNREEIETAEREGKIRLDVEVARKATLTKAKPFLGVRYQEKRK